MTDRAGRCAQRVVAAVLALVVIASCTSRGPDDTAASTAPSDGSAANTTSVPGSTASTGDGATNDDSTSVEAVPIDGSTPVAAPDASGLPSISDPDADIVIGELDNGVRYLIRNNDNPGRRVEMRLAVDAGSGLEDDDQIGGAHYLEHMLFNGTERYPRNELLDVLRSFGAAFGADINASTGFDETIYQLTMSTDDPEVVATGIDVLDQWLTAATIAEADVDDERGVILDEWRGSDSDAGGRIFDAIEELLLSGTTYEGHKPIGTREAIEATTSDPLRRFYDEWYRPDNVGIVVVGDIDPTAIEQLIGDTFSDATDRSTGVERTELTVAPSTEPRAVVHLDPDVPEGFAVVRLPSAVDTELTAEAAFQRALLDSLLFDIIATRLNDDALRGDAPFDDASADASRIVRLLDAPGIVVSADGDQLEEATQAVLDEIERVRRFGVTEAEVARAVASARSASETNYAGRETRQDASFADEYVRHLLSGEAIPSADDQLALETAVLDGATPVTVAFGLVDRLRRAAPHMLVVAPEADEDAVPDADVFITQATTRLDRDIDPRPESAVIGDALMVAPDPVEPIEISELADGSEISFVAPVVIEYPNGARAVFNQTSIVDGNVAFEARRSGGLHAVADADVPSAVAAGPVVGASGVGEFGPVELEAFLDDQEVGLASVIDVFHEGLSGGAATADLETLFQLIHLAITAPRVDDVALERYIDDEEPFAEDPGLDPGYAEFVALSDARYDDPRFLPPTPESLATVDAATIERVFADRFGDAGGWTFAFSGDIDPATARELADRYIGSLPGTGAMSPLPIREPDPPAGIVEQTVTAGQSEAASVAFLFTAPASTDPQLDVVADVAQAVITTRLTDTIREELGDSYSPFAVVQIGDGGDPFVDTYLSNSTGPDLVDQVSAAVQEQLADLRSAGPSEQEFAAALAGVRQRLELYSNPQINDEVLAVFTDPQGTPSFDEFLTRERLAATVEIDDVAAFLERALPPDRYIEIRTLPR
ncbi:MAG: insulinase family protein [Actinomycetota bacterium]